MLVTPDNCNIDYSSTLPARTPISMARYTCTPPRFLSTGEDTRTCLFNLTWSGTDPTCKGKHHLN